MFRSARQDPRDHAALLILLHGYCSCNEHNEVFTAYSSRHVGEFHQLLLGGGGEVFLPLLQFFKYTSWFRAHTLESYVIFGEHLDFYFFKS